MARKKKADPRPWITPAYREHMSSIGREGGLSRSSRKKKASKRNLKKAMAAKFPNAAKHKLS